MVTRNIRKPGEVGNLNFCTFIQIDNSLTSYSFEIPNLNFCTFIQIDNSLTSYRFEIPASTFCQTIRCGRQGGDLFPSAYTHCYHPRFPFCNPKVYIRGFTIQVLLPLWLLFFQTPSLLHRSYIFVARS